VIVGVLFVFIYAAIFIHWSIPVAYLTGILLLTVITNALSKKIKLIQKKIVGETTALAGSTTESLRNIELVKSLGADIVIDYKKDDFETILHDYDVVLNSQDAKTLEKSVRVLKPGGKLISISGPPDPDFAKEIGLSWILRLVMTILSYRIRRKAKRRNINYSFLFMTANGDQLREITSLIDAGIIRPVVDRIFPFESTNDALAYVKGGRAKGKVVVKVI